MMKGKKEMKSLRLKIAAMILLCAACVYAGQTYYSTLNPSDSMPTFRNKVETNLNTLRSSFSGTTEPSSHVAGQLWFDDTVGFLNVSDGFAWYRIPLSSVDGSSPAFLLGGWTAADDPISPTWIAQLTYSDPNISLALTKPFLMQVTGGDIMFKALTASKKFQVIKSDGDVTAEIDVDTGALTLDTALGVASGGTGANTLTDHGILLGSGVGSITPLGAATNGQLPIGSTGADPVLAVITEGTGIDVANGAGSITISLANTLYSDSVDVGNVGGGVDTLKTYSLAGGTLSSNGQRVKITAWGTFAANANPKDLRMVFGGTAILDTTALVFGVASVKDWRIEATVMRTGATSQEAFTIFTSNDLSVLATTMDFTEPAETLSGAVGISCTGEDSGGVPLDDSIVQEGMIVEILPAE